eukprot:m51a1_g8692 hypothetical protein (1074) ;mRNA; r:42553-46551
MAEVTMEGVRPLPLNPPPALASTSAVRVHDDTALCDRLVLGSWFHHSFPAYPYPPEGHSPRPQFGEDFVVARRELADATRRPRHRRVHAATMAEALAVLASLLRERTGPLHRCSRLSRIAGAPSPAAGALASVLPQPVRALLLSVFRAAAARLRAEGLATGCPAGDLHRAVAVLRRMRDALARGDEGSARALAPDLAQALPLAAGAGDLSAESLERSFEACALLGDLAACGEGAPDIDAGGGASGEDDVDALYLSLSCDVEWLSPESQEVPHETVASMVRGGSGAAAAGVQVRNVFAVRKAAVFEAFAARGLGNSRVLFHGTKPESVVGILAHGLRLPEVSAGLLGAVRTNAGDLGAGLYFAPDSGTCVKYTAPLAGTGSRFLCVCQVALGRALDVRAPRPELAEAPEGYDSVHAFGGPFADHEFCVYREDQQFVKYLVEFAVPDDGVPATAVRVPPPTVAGAGAGALAGFTRQQRAPDESRGQQAAQGAKAPQFCGIVAAGGADVPMEAASVRARLVDAVAHVVVLQQFANTTAAAIEGKYVFPLDPRAAVTGFEAHVNDRRVVGVVKEKEAARREFREAVARGDGAYLLDEAADSTFALSLGNIAPLTRVVVRIEYVAELEACGADARRWTLPVALAPRRRLAGFGAQTQSATGTALARTTASTAFGLEVAVCMPTPIRQVASPTHPVAVKRAATRATVRWPDGEGPPASDFVLVVRAESARAPSLWVEESPAGGRAAMAVLYPQLDAAEDAAAESVVVVDCSGSMSACLADARAMARALLQGAPDLGLINVFAFGSSFESCFMGSVRMTPRSSARAEAFIQGIGANMGSSGGLFHALQALFLEVECRDEAQWDTNVFVVTDGHYTGDAHVHAAVGRHCGRPGNRTRVLSLGMGPDPDRHNVETLARAGCGAAEFVGRGSPWRDQHAKQLARARQASLGQVSVEWLDLGGRVCDVEQAPQRVTTLFSNERTIIYGFIPRECVSLRLTAHTSSELQSFQAVVSASPATLTKGLVVHRLDWESGNTQGDEAQRQAEKERRKPEIVALGVKYSLATSLTSFIGVEERSEAQKRG